MKQTHHLPALGLSCLLGWAAQAQVLSIVHSNESVGTAYNNGIKILDRFTVAAGSFQIRSVGLYNPYGSAQPVEVYKNGVLNQTITGANGATGNVWKYANLSTPIVVGAGEYVEVFFTNQNGAQNYAYSTSGLLGNFTTSSKYSTTLSDSYATVRDSGAGWGATASTLSEIAVVPEPGEWTMVGALAAGVAGLVIRRRRVG